MNLTYETKTGLVLVPYGRRKQVCRCPKSIGLGGVVAGRWVATCPTHGVASDWFRALRVKPLGYEEISWGRNSIGRVADF